MKSTDERRKWPGGYTTEEVLSLVRAGYYAEEARQIEAAAARRRLREEPEAVRVKPLSRGPATLVCVGGRIVGDAVVVVSDKDPNWWRGMAAVRQNGRIEVGGSDVNNT